MTTPRKPKTIAVAAETTETLAPAGKAAPIVAYKGFDTNLTCRGFAYAVGGTYRHDGAVRACESGFHACEHPLDVFGYYPPATSRYALVEMAGETAREKGGDSKIAAAEITIRAELRLPEIIAAAIRYVMDRVRWIDGTHAEGEREGVRATKVNGAATASGDGGAATASGNGGAATASGDGGAATASGDGGAATASGTRGAATASGTRGAATASGFEGKVRGRTGCALFLVERAPDGSILAAWAGIAGRDGIKADTFYRLVDGKPVEVE